jgi:nitrate reductase alpha subunit
LILSGKANRIGKSIKDLPRNSLSFVWGIWVLRRKLFLIPSSTIQPGELSQPDVKEWRKGECPLIPGKTAPSMKVVERDYPATYERFTTLGPLMEKLGNGGKGIGWNTQHEVDFLKKLNGEKHGRVKIESDIDACEMVLISSS